jgi:hypothetical protein
MKVLEEILKREEIKGIAAVNKEGEVVFKGKEGEFFQESVGIIGSAGEASLKNIGIENFSYIKLYLKDGSNIYIIKEKELYIGIKGEEIDIDEIVEFIRNYKEKVEIKEELPPKEEILRKPEGMVERFVEMKIKQINALISEFSEGDEIRWGKVVIAKIKDTSPEFAEHLIQESKEIKVKYPISPSLNEEEINRCFRTAIDIIWKMAVSKYGVEEARKRVKMVSDRLRES